MADTGAQLEQNRVHLRLDKARTNPVNSYIYFSADQDQENRSTSEPEPSREAKDDDPEYREEASPHWSPSTYSSAPEEDYQTAEEEDVVPKQQPPKQKKNQKWIVLSCFRLDRMSRVLVVSRRKLNDMIRPVFMLFIR
jgi:hypothetical protein